MSHQKNRKRQRPGRFLSIVVLIFAVLIVFEGKLLINIFSKETFKTRVDTQINDLLTSSLPEPETESEAITEAPETERITEPSTDSESTIDSSVVVTKQPTAVDDSYFSDAVFIGDSRMEGFRNVSGLTTGTFLTGVGMSLDDVFTTAYVNMYNEQITVFQALYDTDYTKVYIMLGTNNLGEYDWEEFKDKYRVCLGEIRKQLPNAAIYVIEVAYVDETKVTTGDYVNNTNIDKANEKILELCEENGYYYVNVNEVLSDGNGALIPDASSDGIHLYQEYCQIWLDYLKTHYIPESEISSGASSSSTTAETETETTTETELETETQTNGGV